MKLTHFIATSLMSILVTSTSVASAAPTASVGSGTTTVRFNNAFTSTLRSATIRLSKVEESKLDNNTIRFPIIEGILDLANARGEIEHAGGFRLSTKSTFIRFINPILDTQGFSQVITGDLVVNDSVIGRIPLFDVTLPTLSLPIKSAKTITIQGIVYRLRSEAADAINTALNQTVFRGGQRVGRGAVTLNTGRSR